MKKIFYLGPSASYCDLAKNKFKELRDINDSMRNLVEEVAAEGYITEEVKVFSINMFQSFYESDVAMLIRKRRGMH